MTVVTTRLATPDDVPAIARLHAEGWESFRAFLPEAVWGPRTEERRRREWPAALREREVILAEEDGRALGFVSVWVERGAGELSTFFVAEEARGPLGARRRSRARRELPQRHSPMLWGRRQGRRRPMSQNVASAFSMSDCACFIASSADFWPARAALTFL